MLLVKLICSRRKETWLDFQKQLGVHIHVQWNPSIPDILGTASSVLIKGSVLISGVILYTFSCSWGHVYSVLIKGDVLSSGVPLWRGSTVIDIKWNQHTSVTNCVGFSMVRFPWAKNFEGETRRERWTNGLPCCLSLLCNVAPRVRRIFNLVRPAGLHVLMS